MKRPSAAIYAAMCLLLLWAQTSPVLVALASPQTVSVFNADDLRKLAKDCSFDKWSKDKVVVLEADIDLADEDFIPIPIFGGTFDGKGHRISGLSVNVEGSNQGLFRYLQEGAVVKNLSVEGAVTPGGDKRNIGGIVGSNSGVVEDCSFSGLVRGKDNVGGIVGSNDARGIVINCSVKGVVYGKSVVGGVAGYNNGTILRSSNEASVNTTVEEESINFQELTADELNLVRSFVDAMDIGGIAGINAGVVQSSDNRGIIGYPHVGYNVGGVAGRQSGYIVGCLNYGEVYGRKEVGGVVGQMEPHITTSVVPSELKVLQKELERLQSLITNLTSDTQASSNAMSEVLSPVGQEFHSAKTHAQSLIDQTEALLNKDIEEINRISLLATEVMDRLVPITDSMADLAHIAEESLTSVRQSLHHLSKAMSAFPEISDSVRRISGVLDECVEKVDEAMGLAREAAADLASALKLLLSGETDGVMGLLDSAHANLKEAGKRLQEAIEGLRKVKDYMIEIMSLLGRAAGDLGHALGYLEDALLVLEEAEGLVPFMLTEISDLMEYLSTEPPLDFATTDDAYRKTKDDLFGSIGNLADSLFRATGTLKTQGDVLLADIQKVSDQLFLVIDLVVGIIDGVSSGIVDLSDVVEDVSRNDVSEKAEGKVSDCKNLGVIEGDINVGGIAGAMSIEFLKDLEEEWSLEDKPALRTAFKTRTVVIDCENRGEVVGKKDNAGGIVGNMDFGYITDCISAGLVESTDGHYVGGIAGRSHSAIHCSYAKSTLGGGNYVGGIAGLGQEIVECRSLVTIDRGRACLGAIAGYAENHNAIQGNYFVSADLAGIDGISYVGRAEPVSYEEFAAIEGLPSIFKEFELTFWDDEKLVSTIRFDYGDSIGEEDIPEVPQKPGYYGRWAGLPTVNLTLDRKVRAEYFPYERLLGSQENREGPLPVVLVEGRFTDRDSLTLTEVADGDGPSLGEDGSEDRFIEGWRVTIPDDGASSHTIRFIPPNKGNGLTVYLWTDEGWTEADVQWDGKYMVFEAPGNTVNFAIASTGFFYGSVWVGVGVVAGVGLALLAIVRRRRKAYVQSHLSSSS